MGRIYVREELADDGRLHENFPIENQHWYEGPRIELQKVCRSRSVDVNDDLLERNPELRESDIGTICPYMALVHSLIKAELLVPARQLSQVQV